jgi:hypothetical protein
MIVKSASVPIASTEGSQKGILIIIVALVGAICFWLGITTGIHSESILGAILALAWIAAGVSIVVLLAVIIFKR